jgi:spore cortex formation protein SpoVR/YcgB (stage V sporulation)
MECEERYGAEVEATLDSCHALMDYGVDRYRRPQPISSREKEARRSDRAEHERRLFNDLWRTLPPKDVASPALAGERPFPAEPEENLLYFIEKHSPRLAPWQREIARIVRKLSQYFYPQVQSKVMNEGWATFWHYTLINTLYDKRVVSDAFMFEFLHHHTNVVTQRAFDEKGYHGINPYALGFAMMRDIRRICEHPDREDREWFPEIAGGDWRRHLDFAMRNFKDESFIAQYLSPRLIRELRLFVVADHAGEAELSVDSIHDEHGYRRVRRLLAEHYRHEGRLPDIQVARYERESDRSLVLRNQIYRGRPLHDAEADEVLRHLGRLWGFPVRLESVSADGAVQGTREWRP